MKHMAVQHNEKCKCTSSVSCLFWNSFSLLARLRYCATPKIRRWKLVSHFLSPGRPILCLLPKSDQMACHLRFNGGVAVPERGPHTLVLLSNNSMCHNVLAPLRGCC